ncbi:hypothetical protein T190_02865 [Sinorhizobium meliloti CCBAU 01290]|nr:hypothetical protein T190_02865 [Sinorhizobium meliloti CCBAU 01290]
MRIYLPFSIEAYSAMRLSSDGQRSLEHLKCCMFLVSSAIQNMQV